MAMVAPLVGAWIEIINWDNVYQSASSLLSWERGLKFMITGLLKLRKGRSSRGSVD